MKHGGVAIGPPRKIRKNCDFFDVFDPWKNCLRWPQIGPGGSFPTNPDLADNLGRTDLDFENFYFLHSETLFFCTLTLFFCTLTPKLYFSVPSKLYFFVPSWTLSFCTLTLFYYTLTVFYCTLTLFICTLTPFFVPSLFFFVPSSLFAYRMRQT